VSELRPFALVGDGDQWVRASYDGVFLDRAAGVIELAWTTSSLDVPGDSPALGAGLAFDEECRLYHTLPTGGRVERIRWAASHPLAPSSAQPKPVDLIVGGAAESFGDFASDDAPTPLAEPRGVAVDVNDRLFIAETANDDILIYDLWSSRLVRRVAFPAGARPTDLAAHGTSVYAVLAGAKRVVRLTARAGPEDVDIPAACTDPSRVAVSPNGTIALLSGAGTAAAHVWFVGKGREHDDFDEPLATDLEWESDGVLVLARQKGADFRRYQVSAGERAECGPLRARGYDGLGIVATPETVPPRADGSCPSAFPSRRIAYWTDHGLRNAVPARLEYQASGRVTTFRLDSGDYQTVWGRLFIDACIPDGTEIRAHFAVLDEADEESLMLRLPPANVMTATVIRPDLSPPMPPLSQVPDAGELPHIFHRRESGRELPWAQPSPDDPFETYETPIDAPAGRFLWVTLELRGTLRASPRVRCLRAEHPSHDYLRRLPRTFSRDATHASFLLRYLSMFEGFLGEVEARAADRDVLLHPRATPDETLPWLASFLGLVLDERWATAPRPGGRTEDARRAIIAQAAWLFRFRGTVAGLRTFIELYVGVPVVILERFRLRGIGGGVVGESTVPFSNAVLGAGFRVGGAEGEGDSSAAPLDGTADDAFRTHAHRFTVIIPATLDATQLDVVRHILDVHRPAHTIFELCTVGAGMRVGRGLHAGISSVIGRTGEFQTLQLGATALGRNAIVGRPENAPVVGATRLADGGGFRL
jgi:phage tail-like protein